MKGRAFAAVVLSALLLLSGLGIGGWWLLWQRGPLQLAHHRLAMPRAARFVPASASFSLYLFSDGQRPVDYARAVAPARQRRPAGEAIARLRDGAFAAAGLDYEDELAGWLGGDIAMALFEDPVAAVTGGSPEQSAKGWLLALASRDDDGARRFLQRFWQTRSLAGTDLQVSRYRGMGLISGRGALLGSQPEPLATALVDDDLVLIASGRNLLERALDVSQIPELNQSGQPLLRQGVAAFASGAALAVASPGALHSWLGLPSPVSASAVAKPMDLSQAAAATRGLPRTAALAAALPASQESPPADTASERPAESLRPEDGEPAVPATNSPEQGEQTASLPSARQPLPAAPDAGLAPGAASRTINTVPQEARPQEPETQDALPQDAETPGLPASPPQAQEAPLRPNAAPQPPPPGSPAPMAGPVPDLPVGVSPEAPAASAEGASAPPAGTDATAGGAAPGEPAPLEPSRRSPAPQPSLEDRSREPSSPLSARQAPRQPATPANPAAPPAINAPAAPTLLAVLQPQGRQLELHARLLLPEAPRLAPLQPEQAEALLAALRGSPESLALIQDPAALGQVALLRTLLERSLGLRPQGMAERQGPLPALLARSIQGPLLASQAPMGWQLASRAGDPVASALDPLLREAGLLEAPLSVDGHSLRVWTHLSLPGRTGRRDRGGSDALVAPLAGWSEQRQELAWWGQTLATLEAPEESRSLTTLRRGLRELGVPQAPLQWSLDGDGARALLRSWQPWRLLSALAGGGLDGPVRGLALALESPPDVSALELRARLNLGD